MPLPLSFPNMVTARIDDRQQRWLKRNGGDSAGIRAAIDSAMALDKSKRVMKKAVGPTVKAAKKVRK